MALCLAPCFATAQEAGLEEIVVTGTRIVRPDFVSASPIVSVPAEAFARQPSVTAESTLNRLPQVVPTFTSTSNERAAGIASVNLRGLGNFNTLVLIDGRRLTPADAEGTPDLNVIPPALIRSVEVVTGGASAVYGSDAVAGVVNFRLRDDFDGVEIGGNWSQTSRSDGDEYDLSLTAGTLFADGRGSIAGYAGYANREQVNARERRFARVTLFHVGAGNGITGPKRAYFPVGSGVTDEGNFTAFASPETFDAVFAQYGHPPGSVPYQWQFGVNDDDTLFTMGLFEPDTVVNFRGTGDPFMLGADTSFRYGYNFAPSLAMRSPLERVSLFGNATFDITDDVEAYAQALFADYSVHSQSAPGVLLDVSAPVTNPFIPDDLRVLLAARDPDEVNEPFPVAKRMSVIGPRNQENQYDMYQVTAGVRGGLADDWRYDLYVQYGANDSTQTRTTEVRRSRALELLYAPDGGVAICGGFDVFGPGSVSKACGDYIAGDVENRVESSLAIVEGQVQGSPFDLPAGAATVVLGAMYLEREYSYDGDDLYAVVLPDGGSDIPGTGARDFGADDHNVDLYVEAALPLFGGITGVRSLEAVLGYRYSDYASAGGIDTWKAELLYEPVASLRLRGSYQRAVRAPSILELYEPQLSDYNFFEDPRGEPCAFTSVQRQGPDAAAVEALCFAQGLSAELLPDYWSDVVYYVSGGNPDLDPEQATTYTLGFVLRPQTESRWLDDLQFAVDWYSIEIDDSIQFIYALEAVENCFDPTLNPGYDAGNFWCTGITRDPDTGEVVDYQSTYRNVASLETTGIDVQLDWSAVAGPGRVHAGWLVGWVDSYEVRPPGNAPPEESVGRVGGFAGSLPEWKWNLRVGYDVGGFASGVTWRYVDSMRDRSLIPGVPTGDVKVPSVQYFDLDLSYAFEEGAFDGLELRAGVENLTDEDPPIFPSSPILNTDPSQYDVLGRRYFVGLNYSF